MNKLQIKRRTIKINDGIRSCSCWRFIFLYSVKSFFTAVPALLAELTRPIFPSHTGQIIVESVIKLMLLLSYIYFISLTPLIKRVFQYHGAEHKVINAYENNLPLTVENVQKQTRLHYRCGSSFIIFTVIIGMFVYFLVPTDPLLGTSYKQNFINSSCTWYFF